MHSPQEEIETVQTMLKINSVLHDSVSNIDFPEVNLAQADSSDHKIKKIELTDENFDQVDIDGAEGWWKAWCEVRSILNDAFENDVKDGDGVTMSEVEPNEDMSVQNESVRLSVRLYNGVGVSYVAEYRIEGSDSWVMLYEGDASLEKFEGTLMRNVVRTELAIIANATQSAAETIDYWMTESGDHSWSQSSWAEARGVGRQTVNDRVRSAVDAIED